MVFPIPQNVLLTILGYVATPLPMLDICRVTKEWYLVVKICQDQILDRFFGMHFSLEWLAMRHSVAPANIELRLRSVMDKHCGWERCEEEDGDVVKFWFLAHLHLMILCSRQQWPRGPLTLRRVIDMCVQENTAIGGYDATALEPFIWERLAIPHFTRNKRISMSLFEDAGFVKARDLGCPCLDTTVYEVLLTLGLLVTGTLDRDYAYCPHFCRCREND